ncbi:hypothetical protein [Micromonospora sp. NPDC047730]|uniref:hypothetical protein n=1 Tax=Micromonospora sp. NPDC047730 TaxID=3364253 RepID=UPI00371CB69E
MKTELRVEWPGRVVTWEGDLPVLPEGHLVTLPEVAAARIVVSMVHLNADGSSLQVLVCR